MYLTYETALEALEKAVADRGEEYVYPKPASTGACLYWHSDEQAPGCLVGLALHQLGVPAEVLESFAASTISVLALGGGLRMSIGALELMGRAQAYQDRGVPWGQALERAVEEVPYQLKDVPVIEGTEKSWLLTSA